MVMNIGIMGTGNIAPAYIHGCRQFPEIVQIVACADLQPEKASAFAHTYGLQAQSVTELLNNDSLDLIINLTIPAAHAAVSQQIIAAGKHVYIEKPLALTREKGQQVLTAAQAKGVRVGCAPDTFLGAGGQTCRQLIDSGAIGHPIAATAFMANHGHEDWHPNPSFYYQPGGGPLFDMGPYYLTALVNLMGPMQTITAMTKRSFNQRVAQHETIKGQVIPVNIDTHIAGSVSFVSGAIATIIMSFDIWSHNLPRIEIYGTKGSLVVPDPNHFDGQVLLRRQQDQTWQPVKSISRAGLQRGMGIVDMAQAITQEQPHRASGQLAHHILDAMQAFYESAQQQQHINLNTQPNRPMAQA